jgi:hypothetical protein
MFGTHVDAHLPITKEASSSFPFFTKDPQVKKTMAWSLSQNWNSVTELFRKGDYRGLLKDHGVLLSFRILMRAQADSVSRDGDHFTSKEREVPHPDVARGQSTKMVKADKRVFVSGSEVKGHFAQRVRMVYAATGGLNYLFAGAFQRFRAFYLEEYAFTWKHRGGDDMRRKTEKYDTVAAFDVSRMDQTVARWQLDPMFEVLETSLTPATLDLLDTFLRSPCWVPDPEKGGVNHFWTADPLDRKSFDDVWWGLPSGIAPNPDIGKFVMTVAYLCIIDDYFGDVLETGVPRILKGEHKWYAVLNMSDDSVILLKNSEQATRLQTDLAEGNLDSPYMKIEREEGTRFLGSIFHKDELGKLHISPDITSYFVNWYVPERGTQRRGVGQPSARQFWPLGYRLRKEQYYQEAPAFARAMDIQRDIWREHFPDLPSPENLAARYERNMDISISNQADVLVMDDPAKLHYMFGPNDVSAEIFDLFQSGFAPSEAKIVVNPLFKEAL